MKQRTRTAIREFVLRVLPKARSKQLEGGLWIVFANPICHRALSDRTEEEDQAWLNAAERLGWVAHRSEG